MNDEEYLFSADCRDRKNLARQARYVKKGSKSKKCSLPSDSLTESQRKKMNGGVRVYNINSLWTWREFKSASTQTRSEYVKALRMKYGVPDKNLAEALGVCYDSVHNILGRTRDYPYYKQIPRFKKELWESFVRGVSNEVENDRGEETSSAVTPSERELQHGMTEISVSYQGEADDISIINSIKMLSEHFSGKKIAVTITARSLDI